MNTPTLPIPGTRQFNLLRRLAKNPNSTVPNSPSWVKDDVSRLRQKGWIVESLSTRSGTGYRLKSRPNRNTRDLLDI